MNKKYLPSALILYLNYFIHGVGCSILGQAVIKEALAASWGVETMAITAIAAALGLGRLIALPFAGPLSDKLGRRISTAIGSASYAIYLICLVTLIVVLSGQSQPLMIAGAFIIGWAAASKMAPSQVMLMNIVLTAIGVALGLFVNLRYKKMVELANE